MRNLFTLLSLFLLLSVLAQEQPSNTPDPEKRLIVIDSSGASQSGNLRSGPIVYEHPDPEGIKATVSTLSIFSQKAVLRSPENSDLTLAQAKGQRVASFTEGVRVTRGRLEAKGPLLTYDEATGIGTLSESANIVVAPKDEETQPTFITANSAEFNVDTDVSTSRGDVTLDNGNQQAQADEMVYEEERTLGVLNCSNRQCIITREDADGNLLTITANSIRVLTDSKKLHAIGAVTVVDGSITSKGDEVFFDDSEALAEVVGNPAEAVDENGTVSGARLLQDIENDVVEPMNAAQPSAFDATDFLLSSEKGE
jgi:lipopolysaccharide export system protein LptA